MGIIVRAAEAVAEIEKRSPSSANIAKSSVDDDDDDGDDNVGAGGGSRDGGRDDDDDDDDVDMVDLWKCARDDEKRSGVRQWGEARMGKWT